NTHVYLMEATQDTHTHTSTRRPEVTIPDRPSSRTPQEQWAALQRPGTKSSELSIFGQGWTCVLLFCMFFSVGVLSGGNPLWTRGEHANSTQQRPGERPAE